MSNPAKIAWQVVDPAPMTLGPQPFASVITPAYRAERFLGECLASVRDQSFSDLECIVVDDASPESDSLIAAQFAEADRRFRGLRHPANRGVRSEEHTSELQSLTNLVCRLLLEKK